MFKPVLRRLIPATSSLAVTALVQRSLGRFVPIFMLHRLDHPDYGIRGQSPARLREHLEYFRRKGYSAISLQRLGELLRQGEPPPTGSAVFTIDDGFIDHHDIAGPLFADYDIPLTYFLVTGLIDGELWPWDDQLSYVISQADAGRYRFDTGQQLIELDFSDAASRRRCTAMLRQRLKQVDNTDLYQRIAMLFELLKVERPSVPPRQYQPMSWQQANALVATGHRVAAHTRSHRILSRLSHDDAGEEIGASIRRVGEMVADASPVFAYPTGCAGDFGTREFATVEHHGITATVSTVSAPYIYNNDVTQDIHQLPRLAMPDSHHDFIQYLGWIEFIKHRLRSH